jgi:hypothetical protein
VKNNPISPRVENIKPPGWLAIGAATAMVVVSPVFLPFAAATLLAKPVSTAMLDVLVQAMGRALEHVIFVTMTMPNLIGSITVLYDFLCTLESQTKAIQLTGTGILRYRQYLKLWIQLQEAGQRTLNW